jgi:membrane protein implicated in regulation of membrane protease activity
MIVLGLLLVLAGLLIVMAALFSSDGTATMLGNELTALTIFLLGLVSGLAVLWGYAVLKFGTRRTLQRRREHKQLTELSEKLDRVEAQRSDEDRDGEPRA